MNTSNNYPSKSSDEELHESISSSTEDAVEEDGTPVLDEKDLEENNLTVEDSENIEWEEPKQSGNK